MQAFKFWKLVKNVMFTVPQQSFTLIDERLFYYNSSFVTL